MNILNEFDLIQKFFYIIINNISNNRKFIKYFNWELVKLKINWDSKIYHINYLNHILYLAIIDFLKKIKILDLKTKL